MTTNAMSTRSDIISFLNRDHVVLVTVDQEGIIIVTTSLGMKITFPTSQATLAKFIDELANDVESNFVSIASSPIH
jgi:hypothetical protein